MQCSKWVISATVFHTISLGQFWSSQQIVNITVPCCGFCFLCVGMEFQRLDKASNMSVFVCMNKSCKAIV